MTRAASAAGALLLVVTAGAAAAAAIPHEISDARLETRAALDPAPIAAALGSGAAEWLAWSVPALPAAAELCCFHGRGMSCSLAGDDEGWGSNRDGAPPTAPATLTVLAEIERGRPRRLRLAGESCPIAGAGKSVLRLDGVDPARSLAYLDALARGGDAERVAGPAVAALAYHAGAAADRLLAALAFDSGLDEDRREQALFWSGEIRGRAGYELLDRFLDRESDADLREHALFALSQSGLPEANERLRRASREERDPELRGHALFCLSQTGDPRAADWILAALATDPDAEAREQGVFALSQLDDGVDHLVGLLRDSRDPDLRRQALFWLGQSDDPLALAELERVLGR